MLQNAYLLAKIGADTAENEQHFAEIVPIGRRLHHGDAEDPAARAELPGDLLREDAPARNDLHPGRTTR